MDSRLLPVSRVVANPMWHRYRIWTFRGLFRFLNRIWHGWRIVCHVSMTKANAGSKEVLSYFSCVSCLEREVSVRIFSGMQTAPSPLNTTHLIFKSLAFCFMGFVLSTDQQFILVSHKTISVDHLLTLRCLVLTDVFSPFRVPLWQMEFLLAVSGDTISKHQNIQKHTSINLNSLVWKNLCPYPVIVSVLSKHFRFS